jgi:hypothetical protein
MIRSAPGLLALGSALIGLAAWAETSHPGLAAQPAGPLPTPFPEMRYQQMSAKSPFAVASATAEATAAPTPGFAAQLYVDGIAHAGSTDYVAIKTRAPEEGKPAVVLVEVGKSTEDGIKVESVKWSDEPGKSTVDVSKAGEKATLSFDEDTIKSAPAPAQGPVPGGVRLPMMPGQRPPGFPVNGFQPGPQFNRMRVFPQQPQTPGQAGPVPGMDMRRRIRSGMIQSGQ